MSPSLSARILYSVPAFHVPVGHRGPDDPELSLCSLQTNCGTAYERRGARRYGCTVLRTAPAGMFNI